MRGPPQAVDVDDGGWQMEMDGRHDARSAHTPPRAEFPSATRPQGVRWLMVAVLTSSFFGLTLQWYAVVPAFGEIGEAFDVGFARVSLLASLFFFGYAIAHIPVGFLSAAIGAKRVVVLGMLLLAVTTVLSGVAGSYAILAVLRTVGGVGAAALVGAGLQLGASWARSRERKFVLGGLLNGVGFTLGAAAALYVWVGVVESIGWRGGLATAGVIGLVLSAVTAAVLKMPPQVDALGGGHLSWRGVARSLASRNLWGVGLGGLGAYAAFFTVSQIGPSYAQSTLGFTAAAAGLLAATVLLVGVPGGLIGGLVSDHSSRFLPTLMIPGLIVVALVALLPFVQGVAIWLVQGGIGFLLMFLFAPLAASPAEYGEIGPEDYATGVGLVLLLCNLGAVIDPIVYASITESLNPTAGWLAIAAIALVSWFGFFLVREPRRRQDLHPRHDGQRD